MFNADTEVLSCYIPKANTSSSNQSTRLATHELLRIANMQTAHTRPPGALIAPQFPIAMGIVDHLAGKPWPLSSTRNHPLSVADQG